MAAPRTNEELAGWGRAASTASNVHHVVGDEEIIAVMHGPHPRGVLARGMGRSYGDAAQCAGGDVLDMTGDDGFRLDAVTGLVTARAGVSLDRLLRHLVPRGWFVPVTPGTRQVSVGGAIAADIHGKNHHVDGSWCQHILSMQIALADGTLRTLDPTADPQLFWATAGGMGLTGVVTEATFQATAIGTSRLLVDTDRTQDLDELLTLMAEGDHAYPYSVAWTDLCATGRSLGRSVLTRGRFATPDELRSSGESDETHLAYNARELLTAPPVAPSGLLNRATIRAFNEAWYRKAPRHRTGELQSIATFFHPLDFVRGWNRLYGPGGFVQWQMVVPDAATEVVRSTCERLASAGTPSFLAVLKRFGPGNPGPLSFPMQGWTLALDIPARVDGLGELLDSLDEDVVEAGGRIYLAKDSRLRPELVAAMYPRLDEWRAVRDGVDPERRLRSDLARRLRLC